MIRLPKTHLAAWTFYLSMSGLTLAAMSLGGCKPSFLLILLCILTCVAQTKAGILFLEFFRLTQIKARLPAAFVTGFAVISLLMLVLVFVLEMPALTALMLSAMLALVLSVYRARRSSAVDSTDGWADVWVTLILGVAILTLAKIPISSPRILLSSNILPIWSDYFLHGITINSLGSPFSDGGNMELAGENRGFYHYAPYVIPAAFQAVSGMSGLALSTSFLLPWGLLIAALGGYVLAVELQGRLSGLIALTVIICFPAYAYFIQSGWFDFYWLMFAAPGTGYAIGVSMLVCVSAMAYFREGEGRVLWLTLLLLFSLILIRAHVFLLLAPAIIASLLFQRWHHSMRLMLLVAFIGMVGLVLTLHFSSHLHALWTGRADPYRYLDITARMYSFYGKPVTFLAHLQTLTAFAQIVATLIAVLGIYVVLYPLTLWLNLRRARFNAADTIPLLLILSFVGLMLFAPIAQNGDLSEYKHRHFPLLYVVVVIYTVTYVARLIPALPNCPNCLRRMGCTFVILAFSVTLVRSDHINPASPDVGTLAWAGNYHNQLVTPGLIEASAYIRAHAQKGDVLAMGVPFVVSDPRTLIVEMVSLTGVPAFIARSELKMRGPKCFQEITSKRVDLLKELAEVENWAEARQVLQAHGIRWFLIAQGDSAKWGDSASGSVFSSYGITIYDAGASVSPKAASACVCKLSEWCL